MTERIAVLGGGVMGETLAAGFLRGLEPRPVVVIAEKRVDRADELRASLGVEIAGPADAVAEADVVVLVVKPQDLSTLLDAVGSSIRPGALVISIAAGISTTFVAQRVAAGVDVVRAMPNTPARIDMGVTAVSPAPGCTPAGLARALELMSVVGSVVEVPEEQQDAATAVSGSGPAYAFLLAESMIAAGVGLGLDAAVARRMVIDTIAGAGRLMQVSDDPPETLRAMVTSPNGTTAAAIAAFEQLGFGATVAQALQAARDRSRELAEGR